jgi:hypothetical protein
METISFLRDFTVIRISIVSTIQHVYWSILRDLNPQALTLEADALSIRPQKHYIQSAKSQVDQEPQGVCRPILIRFNSHRDVQP